MDGGIKKVKVEMGRRGVSFMEDRREWRLPDLLYADDLFLCGETEEDQRAIMRRSAKVCRRRGLKVKASKSKMMILNGGEGLECESLGHVLEFDYIFRVCFGRIRYRWSRV